MDDVCLVTGGAGFIGCAASAGLADRFARVVVLDSLHPQVHAAARRPAALDPRVELVVGDVTDDGAWDGLLTRLHPRVVLHLAAETGTAQSLTESSRHAAVNVLGTTRLLDALVRHHRLPERVVLTSSRAVYGEGSWVADDGRVVQPGQRSHAMLAAGQWDFPGLSPLPAGDPRVTPAPTSVYGATKLAQEHVLRAWGLALDVEPVVLRLQNVYGPGQSLSNPYTGIVPLFARLAREGRAIPLYEDGRIVRDFVYIEDVARAVVAATEVGAGRVTTAVDVGSGVATTIADLAQAVAGRYGAPPPVVTGEFRDGDVRACWTQPDRAAEVLAWAPQTAVDIGLGRLCEWVDAQDGSAVGE